MKVRAATVEQHRFAVRRRGYDRAEVDAVIGRVSQSLRSYEEEMGDLEARLREANLATSEIAASAAGGTRGTQERVMQEEMRRAEEALSGVREKAEEILAAAHAEIEKLFANVATETEQVLTAAEHAADLRRREAESDAEALLSRAEAEAKRLRQEATTAAADAEETRRRAEAEAEEVRAQAERQAALTLAKAKSEHDRLATRIPELHSALTQFEAQLQALATEPVVDLNQIEAEERPSVTASEAPEPAEEQFFSFDDDADEVEAVPVPDGSGTLPAARQLVELDEYRELKAHPGGEEALEDAEQEEAPVDAEPVPTRASAPLDRLATGHVASRVINTDNETIYQRRGGGLRRRINAQNDES